VASTCPINGDNHKYFVHTVKVEFERVDPERTQISIIGELYNEDYYRRVEYAYLGCNCGSAIKSKVKDFQYGEK
jgi:hypothetical protein